MGFLHCCGGLKRSVSYALEPKDGYVLAELDVLDTCPVCGCYIAQVTRVDFDNKVSIIRKTKSQAKKLIQNVSASILYRCEYKYSPFKASKSNFYLSYSEFGKKKKCYSNISNMKISLGDNFSDITATNPIGKLGLKPFIISSKRGISSSY